MNEFDLQGEADYRIWCERSTIADCLRTIGLPIMAAKAMDYETPREIIDRFLNIIKREATIAKRHDVLEQLHFAGLIYG